MFALSSTSSASLPFGTFPSRGRLEERTNQRLPLEGKLSAARLTDEVSKTMLRWYAFWNEEKYRRKKEDGTHRFRPLFLSIGLLHALQRQGQ